MREGVRRVIEQADQRLGNAHYVLAQPEVMD